MRESGRLAQGQFDDIARRYSPALRRFFSKRASAWDVDDLVQQVFERLAAREQGGVIHQPEAYVLRSAGNVWRDFLRKKRTHADAMHESYRDEDYVQTTEGPEAHVQAFQSLALILRALDDLPTRSRYVFVLCRVERLPQKEVARRLGISVSAVEKHMMRAVARLSTHLSMS